MSEIGQYLWLIKTIKALDCCTQLLVANLSWLLKNTQCIKTQTDATKRRFHFSFHLLTHLTAKPNVLPPLLHGRKWVRDIGQFQTLPVLYSCWPIFNYAKFKQLELYSTMKFCHEISKDYIDRQANKHGNVIFLSLILYPWM